jgi:hypothetical protein
MASRAVAIVKRATKIETIEIDSCLEETHAEHGHGPSGRGGFNISDHVRLIPMVNLRCFVSTRRVGATAGQGGAGRVGPSSPRLLSQYPSDHQRARRCQSEA